MKKVSVSSFGTWGNFSFICCCQLNDLSRSCATKSVSRATETYQDHSRRTMASPILLTEIYCSSCFSCDINRQSPSPTKSSRIVSISADIWKSYRAQFKIQWTFASGNVFTIRSGQKGENEAPLQENSPSNRLVCKWDIIFGRKVKEMGKWTLRNFDKGQDRYWNPEWRSNLERYNRLLGQISQVSNYFRQMDTSVPLSMTLNT